MLLVEGMRYVASRQDPSRVRSSSDTSGRTCWELIHLFDVYKTIILWLRIPGSEDAKSEITSSQGLGQVFEK